MIFKLLMSLIFIAIPAGVYKFNGFETSVITGICLIIFFLIVIKEEIYGLDVRVEKLEDKKEAKKQRANNKTVPK